MKDSGKVVYRGGIAPKAANSNETSLGRRGDLAATVGELSTDAAVQRHLGRVLQQSYEELVTQPVPDKFQHLLDQLERREKDP